MANTLHAFLKKFITTAIATLMVVFLFGVGVSYGQYDGVGLFSKISSIGEFEEGYYVISTSEDDKAMNNQHTGTLFPPTDISPSNGTLTNPSVQDVWLIVESGSGYSIYSEDADKYVSYTGTSNNIQFVDEVTSDNQRWNISYDTEENEFVITNVEVPERTLRYNRSSPRFVAYSTGFGENLSLFQFGELEDPVLVTNPNSVSSLNYIESTGPSDAQSFEVSGSNLDGSDVTATAPTNFEVSETEEGTFGSTVTLTAYNGSPENIWVRLAEGLEADTYSGNVTISGGGADPLNVAVDGEVTFNFDFVEDFENFPETSASYNDGSFDGVAGNTWNYVNARGSGTIGDSSPGLQNNSSASLNSVISGGISTFSFDYMQMFSTNVNLEVHINNELVATVTSDDETGVVKNSGLIQVAFVGDFEIEFKQGQGGGQVAINDFSWVSSPGVNTQITGTEGWRMLSLPVGDVAVSTLAGQNLVQGVTGGDAFYDDGGEYEVAAPNLLYYLDSVGDDFQEFDNFDSEISSGQGFIWYMFDNDDFNSVPLPFTLAVSGTSPSADVSIPINPNDDFTLIGNPFAGNLDASDVSSWGDLQATARTWDPDTNQYVDTETEAPFTGFFVETAVGGTGDITIPVAATSSKTIDTEQFRIALSLQGINDNEVAISDNSTSILFREGATHEWDIYDATKLVPLLSSYATIGIVGERAGEERIQAIDSRPVDFSGEIELPLALNVYNFGGEFELSADLINVPEDWSLTLTDHETGETTDLRESAYTFTYNSSAQKVVAVENKLPETFTMSVNETVERFTLTVEAGEAVNIDEPGTGLPQRVALNQNYPNPFNPSTVISYDLPEASDVTIQVYDMTGRQVATLVNSRMEAGTHEVTFNAGNLASGVYIYRLQAGEHMLTRKLTLIK